ncbi:hypothetical protein ACQKWADRAFT_270154 [Trichoderma austrokoningii]
MRGNGVFIACYPGIYQSLTHRTWKLEQPPISSRSRTPPPQATRVSRPPTPGKQGGGIRPRRQRRFSMLDQDPGKLGKGSNLSHSRSGSRRTTADIVDPHILPFSLIQPPSPDVSMG